MEDSQIPRPEADLTRDMNGFTVVSAVVVVILLITFSVMLGFKLLHWITGQP